MLIRNGEAGRIGMRQVVSVISGLSFCLAFLLPTPTVANPDAASPTAGDDQILVETIRATVGDPLKSIVDNARDIEALRTFYSAETMHRSSTPRWPHGENACCYFAIKGRRPRWPEF